MARAAFGGITIQESALARKLSANPALGSVGRRSDRITRYPQRGSEEQSEAAVYDLPMGATPQSAANRAAGPADSSFRQQRPVASPRSGRALFRESRAGPRLTRPIPNPRESAFAFYPPPPAGKSSNRARLPRAPKAHPSECICVHLRLKVLTSPNINALTCHRCNLQSAQRPKPERHPPDDGRRRGSVSPPARPAGGSLCEPGRVYSWFNSIRPDHRCRTRAERCPAPGVERRLLRPDRLI